MTPQELLMHFEFFQHNQINFQHTDYHSTIVQKKEISSNLRIILLAIRLQRLVKNLPSELISAERITRQSLANQYYQMELSPSEESALKMAMRDLSYIQKIFGLEGSHETGYVMEIRFERFYEMFKFWLTELGEPTASNRRMHVMISGLIHSIENGFRDDPIVIPDLAKALKNRYGNKNIRDSKAPLTELFSNSTLVSYLSLLDEENGALYIDKSADPLLMRLRSRDEVGYNIDIDTNLALPGRVRTIFDDHIKHLDESLANKAKTIAKAVRESYLWQNSAGKQFVPYILYQEAASGNIRLVLWQEDDGRYCDISIDEISSVPESNPTRFIPHNMPAKLWEQFTQITA